MTGYLSQLARQTGLVFEPVTGIAARSVATASPVVQRPDNGPPHVEEISFTSAPTHDAPELRSDGLTSTATVFANSLMDRDDPAANTTDGWNREQMESRAADRSSSAKRGRAVSPDVASEDTRIVFTESESGGRFAAEQSFAGVPRAVRPDDRSGTERQPGSPKPTEGIPESIELVESQFAALGPRAAGLRASQSEAKYSDQPQPTSVGESTDAARHEHGEREMIVRNYLKEVRAWVAAPTELDQSELERPRARERRAAEHKEVFALASEVEPTVPRPGRPETSEVQDLNLSIGTISIVIEEPKQAAPAPFAAAPRVERAPERPAGPEPTRLSRYYLRRW